MASRNRQAIDLFGELEKLAQEGADDAKIAEAVRKALGVEKPKASKPAKKKAAKKKAPKTED